MVIGNFDQCPTAAHEPFHSFTKHLLRAPYVLNTVLAAENLMGKQRQGACHQGSLTLSME